MVSQALDIGSRCVLDLLINVIRSKINRVGPISRRARNGDSPVSPHALGEVGNVRGHRSEVLGSLMAGDAVVSTAIGAVGNRSAFLRSFR